MSRPHQADVQEQPDKLQQIQDVLSDVVHRRNAGEMVSDESIRRLRPDLMPELARELGKLRMIEAARQAAEQPPEDSSGDQGISSESDLETQGMPEADELNARAGMLRICCPHCQNPIAIVADDATKNTSFDTRRLRHLSGPNTPMNDPGFFVGWGTLSLINAGLAQSKGRSGLLWWLVSLLISPLPRC